MMMQTKPTEPSKTAYAQRLVLAVLTDAATRGEHLTSRQIGERTGEVYATVQRGRTMQSVSFPISDPRKTIQTLRKAGYTIADETEQNDFGVRYKRYWLVMGDTNPQSNPQSNPDTAAGEQAQ